MMLPIDDNERRKLISTLRWVLTATMMDSREESMIEDIINRLKTLHEPPKPPKVNP